MRVFNTIRHAACWSVLGIFLLVVAAPCGAEDAKFIRGDVDDNGYLDTGDLHAWYAHVFGGYPVAVIESLDVVDDGFLDRADLVALGALLMRPMSGPPPMEHITFERGDLDDDREIGARDARILLGFLRGDTPMIGHLDAADVDSNGIIDARDQAALDDLIFILHGGKGGRPQVAIGPRPGGRGGGGHNPRIIDRVDGPEALVLTGMPIPGKVPVSDTPGLIARARLNPRIIDRIDGPEALVVTGMPIPGKQPPVDAPGLRPRPQHNPRIIDRLDGPDSLTETGMPVPGAPGSQLGLPGRSK